MERIRQGFYADLMATASVRPKRSFGQILKDAARLHRAEEGELRNALNLVGKVIPGFEKGVAWLLTNPSRMAVVDPVEMAASGGEVTVFRNPTLPRVVKVDQLSLDLAENQLLGRAQELQAGHLRAKQIYSQESAMVVAEKFFITPSYLRSWIGKSAVAAVQEYVDFSRCQDLFGLAEPDLVEQMTKNPALLAQISYFGQRTLAEFEQTGQCIDLTGHNNVLIYDRTRLLLLDTRQIVDFHQLQQYGDPSRLIPKTRVKLNELAEISQLAESRRR